LKKQNNEIKNLNKKLNENLERAKIFHQHFFPDQLPEVNHLSFGTHHYSENRLGGDFYDSPAGK